MRRLLVLGILLAHVGMIALIRFGIATASPSGNPGDPPPFHVPNPWHVMVFEGAMLAYFLLLESVTTGRLRRLGYDWVGFVDGMRFAVLSGPPPRGMVRREDALLIPDYVDGDLKSLIRLAESAREARGKSS